MDSSGTLDSVQDLMEEILQIQREKQKDISVIERIQDIVEQSSRLVEKSESTNEIILDARILHTGSQVINSNVTSFDVNLTSFNEEEYKNGLLNFIANNSNGLASEKSWDCLGPMTYHLYSKSTPVTFMLGSLSLDPLPAKEKSKAERCKKLVSEKTKLATSSQTSQKEREEVEENIYEHLLKSLVKCYRENNRKPILFIDFIMDPDSYWHSVENIFYFSFLVRDGRVNMFLNKENLPVVEPVLKGDGRSEGEGNQFSFSLSKKDWEECIEKFEISSAKIKPFHTS